MTLSVYGASGFVGGRFCRLFCDEVVSQEREERKPRTDEILYFISTVDNYNVHTNITLDVETNLKVLCEVLDYCRDGNITFNFISSWFVFSGKSKFDTNTTEFEGKYLFGNSKMSDFFIVILSLIFFCN